MSIYFYLSVSNNFLKLRRKNNITFASNISTQQYEYVTLVEEYHNIPYYFDIQERQKKCIVKPI
jgi:hypothetical protein